MQYFKRHRLSRYPLSFLDLLPSIQLKLLTQPWEKEVPLQKVWEESCCSSVFCQNKEEQARFPPCCMIRVRRIGKYPTTVLFFMFSEREWGKRDKNSEDIYSSSFAEHWGFPWLNALIRQINSISKCWDFSLEKIPPTPSLEMLVPTGCSSQYLYS